MSSPESSDARASRRLLRPYGPDGHDAPRFAYSLGVLCGGMVFIAGQVARDAAGRLIGPADPEAQARQVYENVRAVLADAGGGPGDIVATTTYITDRAYREPVTAVRRSFFDGADYPANTLVIVAGLGLPDYLVEVSAIAVVPRR
ncbi:RidA family protein [Actinomadura soli]|uniref:RidA family protein n=1 Tax=Actinomadura soli TaxID=2508997 RepID=A0A5C4JGU6_9ACTN|nr:RidA family protein [Actinomadura soli]TMR04938.1 RidA family protein [Actinomadura soli]